MYHDRGPNKFLPKRGSLFASSREAIAAQWLRWALMNVALFLFPLVTGLLGLFYCRSWVKASSWHDVICASIYFSTSTGSALIFVASMLFPRFFRYHVVVAAFLGQRRHRSHFSFMSQRRMDQIYGNGQQWYTIFVIGLKSRSLPVLYALYGHLISLGLVPTNRQHLYFTHGGRRVNWTDTMQSLGLGPLSHLQMRVIVPGGANAEAGSSRRPGQYKDSTRMADILAAEGVDEFGKPEKARTSVKHCCFPPFSHSSEECPGAGREIGRKISATQKKSEEKDDPPAAPANSANAPPVEGPSTRKQQRGGKRNVIYLFFEDVEAAGDGSVVHSRPSAIQTGFRSSPVTHG
ncbi:hypothetical protein B0H14DRAFT_2568497 [Mycena olivaceomarginata]|nr:hypothetical protein B0H14DRAFT_2568497 [Mycena olivaceomarginata]